jgi:hypothetical protein
LSTEALAMSFRRRRLSAVETATLYVSCVVVVDLAAEAPIGAVYVTGASQAEAAAAMADALALPGVGVSPMVSNADGVGGISDGVGGIADGVVDIADGVECRWCRGISDGVGGIADGVECRWRRMPMVSNADGVALGADGLSRACNR